MGVAVIRAIRPRNIPNTNVMRAVNAGWLKGEGRGLLNHPRILLNDDPVSSEDSMATDRSFEMDELSVSVVSRDVIDILMVASATSALAYLSAVMVMVTSVCPCPANMMDASLPVLPSSVVNDMERLESDVYDNVIRR